MSSEPTYLLDLGGGPCDGTYTTAHAPTAMNAVIDSQGNTDVLDAPHDLPRLDERLHRYERERQRVGHLCGSDGCMTVVHYVYVGAVRQDGTVAAIPRVESERLARVARRKRMRRVMREDRMERIGMRVIDGGSS